MSNKLTYEQKLHMSLSRFLPPKLVKKIKKLTEKDTYYNPNIVVYSANGWRIGTHGDKTQIHVAYIVEEPNTGFINKGPKGVNKNLIEGLYISENCITIKKNTFENYKNIRYVKFVKPPPVLIGNVILNFRVSNKPKLKIIEDSVFKNCAKLTDFPFERCIELETIGTFTLQHSHGDSFFSCPLNKVLTFPKSIKKIAQQSFGNSNIKELFFHQDTILDDSTATGALSGMCEDIHIDRITGPKEVIGYVGSEMALISDPQQTNKKTILTYNTPFTFKVYGRDSKSFEITDIKFKNIDGYLLYEGEFELYKYLSKHPKTLKLGEPGDYVLVGKVNNTDFKPYHSKFKGALGDTVVFGDLINVTSFANVDISTLSVRYVDEPGYGKKKKNGTYYSIVQNSYVPNKGMIIQDGKPIGVLGKIKKKSKKKKQGKNGKKSKRRK